MKTCLFCRNTCVFNIHTDYANNNHTVKDDMLQFFGYQIESHLRPDDAICNLCMNIMDNVAKLKRRLLPLIFRSESSFVEDCKPLNFGKKWDVFASINLDDDGDPFFGTRSPTPSNLLKCKRIVPYESPVEMKIAEIERHRSLSRFSEARSDADSEIVKVFAQKKTRRKKRGHNWSRRKNGRYSRLTTASGKTSVSSYSRSRKSSFVSSRPISAISMLSTESYESFYPPGADVSTPAPTPSEKNSLRYLNGCLQNKRTRSVAKKQEEEIKMYFTQEELYECPENGCTFICEDIDLMAQHKIEKHKQLALFWCNFCGKKYTSHVYLDIHKRTHTEQYSCVICHKEFYSDSDLLEHWQEHVKKSVPCKYCGKRFVDEKVCNNHQKNVHKRSNPSRIDYNKNIEQNNSKSNGFEVRILVQNLEKAKELEILEKTKTLETLENGNIV